MAGGRDWRRTAASLAGPALVVAAVLVVLHDFAFRAKVTAQHVDLLAYWLPNHCFLGRSLAAGHLPAWNPFVMGGTPFAADPQSGWMYLPAMLLYTVLPCAAALRWFVVLQPIIGGLGMYAFLRGESLSRPAATFGAVVLAVGISGSALAITLPFAAALAWTAVMLAAASRMVRTASWPARLGWAAAAALAWGQVAAAHLSNGLVVGTGALAAYLVARMRRDVREGRFGARTAWALSGLLLAALPLVNLAYFLPRFAYLPRTTLGMGFGGLEDLAVRLSQGGFSPQPIGAIARIDWPLRLATSPGAYFGAAALALALGAWRSRRHRHLVWAFGVLGAAGYAMTLKVVATLLRPVARVLPLGDFYLHSPSRFRYAVLAAIPPLAALGLEAWRDARTRRDRALVALPGAAVFGILPMVVLGPSRMVLPWIGLTAAAALLLASVRRPRLLWAVPVALAVELSASGLLGQVFREGGQTLVRPFGARSFTNMLEPDIDAAAYLRPGAIARSLGQADGGRYLSSDPLQWPADRAYLERQAADDWGLLANGRSTLFRLEEVQGYNPVHSLRLWTFVRTVRPHGLPWIQYNHATFVEPSPPAFDLLQVSWVVGPVDRPPTGAEGPVVREGRWGLFRVEDAPPRASVVTAWEVAPTSEEALATVVAPGFDASRRAVLEGDPGITPSGAAGGTASYRALGPQSAAVEVQAPSAALVVVRNPWDPNWRATVDGRPAPVLRADYLIQAVPVGPGRHEVVLRYDDPWVGRGLAGSAVVLAGLLAGALWLRRRPREGQEPRAGGASERHDRPGHPG